MKKLMMLMGSVVSAQGALAAGFGIYEGSTRGKAMGGAVRISK